MGTYLVANRLPVVVFGLLGFGRFELAENVKVRVVKSTIANVTSKTEPAKAE